MNKSQQYELLLKKEIVHVKQCNRGHIHKYHTALCQKAEQEKKIKCRAHCDLNCQKGGHRGHRGHKGMLTSNERQFYLGYIQGQKDKEDELKILVEAYADEVEELQKKHEWTE